MADRLDPDEFEEWQLAEIRAGIEGLDRGEWVSHEDVSKWMRSWGGAGESKAPPPSPEGK
jgi:predicted transcriptional regulator